MDIWYPKVYVLFFDENHNFVDFAMDTNLGRQYCLAPGASVTLSLESGGPAASAEVNLRTWHGDRELYGE